LPENFIVSFVGVCQVTTALIHYTAEFYLTRIATQMRLSTRMLYVLLIVVTFSVIGGIDNPVRADSGRLAL
jgi:hypothetical protein